MQMTGSELISAERYRQIVDEGFLPEHDAKYGTELRHAASSYLRLGIGVGVEPPISWPFPANWWKPSNDPIRNLVKAGALIAAEIDRLQLAK